MKKLVNCLGKTVGKLISKADADSLVIEARALEAEGLTPIAAERQAIENALEQAKQDGQNILDQIRAQRPTAYGQAETFWNRETIRKAMTPPPLPAFVTEAGRYAPSEARPPAVPPPLPEAPAVAAPPVAAPPPIPEAPAEAVPPPIPEAAVPISDAAQEVVNSLPEEQRSVAQKAFARDDRDPYADQQRADGEPVTKRKGKPIAPEKNTKLVGELSKYDLGKTMSETIANIASDPKQPRWIRLLADLFNQLALGQGVDIRPVNTPEAIWPALYVFNRETGRAEILINLSHKGPDLARRLLHELMHHGTLSKLTGSESDLMPAELAAKRELEKIYNDIRSRPEFKELYGATALHEFVSEIFANDELRAKLDAIKPDGKVSILQRILDSIKAMFIGDRDKIGMRPGTMLDVALREALKVVGSPAVETPSGGVVAPMGEVVQSDTDYMAAVKSGDTATAQRMVDEKARRAGYTEKRWHQTSPAAREAIYREGFILDKGKARLSDEQVPDAFFFKADPKDIGVGAAEGAAQIPVLLRYSNPKVFADRSEVESWANEDFDYWQLVSELRRLDQQNSQKFDAMWDEHNKLDRSDPDRAELRDQIREDLLKDWSSGLNEIATKARKIITNRLRAEGYDAIQLTQDKGSFNRRVTTTAVFDPNQIKSADPVTYDNQGNVMPLSKRFNVKSPLIAAMAEQETPASIAEARVLQRQQASIDPANQGGIDRPSVAAMQYEDQQEPVRDPHGGRTSLVRAMVNALTGASRDKGGIEVPKSEQEVRGVAGAGSSKDQGRKGSAPLWRNLGETFRKREASLYSQVDSAAKLISAANPEDSENPKDPARYQNSQTLLDYLSGKETPTDPELQTQITELRKEIPVIPQAQFKGLDHLDSGSEADVYHDPNSGVVYKFFHFRDGALGDSYVPGPMRLDRAGRLLMSIGERPTLQDFLSRMERANSQGAITPHELTAITPEGQLVFAQPFVEGREVTKENLPAALARADIHFLSDSGGGSGIAKVDNRWILYDDLHPGNVRTMPGGRVEIIDANNRELDSYEISDLTELGKMPPEKPLGTPKERKRKMVEKYDNAILVAPMVETHHGTPHEWEPEVKVRFDDGSEQWVRQSSIDKVGGLKGGQKIIDRAPAGRVRAEKVGTGESNAAFGWGVLYSAQRKGLAEGYRKQLTEAWDPRAFITEIIPGFKQAPDRAAVENELRQYDETRVLADRPDIVDLVTKAASGYDLKSDTYTPSALAALKELDRQLPPAPKGNVYTLRLDVDDPELLDWFMPMADQMWVFDKVSEKLGTTREDAMAAYAENERLAEETERLQTHAWELERQPDTTPKLMEEIVREHAEAEKRWEEHYKRPETKLGRIIHRVENPSGFGAGPYDGEKFYDAMTDLMKSPRAASEFLNSADVPGIVFLDRESRKKPKFEFEVARTGKPTETLGFNTREAAELAYENIGVSSHVTLSEIRENEQLTNNYVMFDPERIKVVAKNGEVIRTVADDMPAPVDPKYEPVSVAAMAEEDVKDDRDLTVAPMAGTGRRTRESVSAENYKPAGWTAPFKRLSWEAVKFVQQKRQSEAATVYRVQTMVKDFEHTVKKVYKGKLSPQENRNIMLALGNLDNRITQEQAREAKKMKGAEREGFLHTAHMENVARFKEQQEQALNSLPDEIREAVNVLREALDLEAKEALKETGLDTELRARLDANQGVFLHSNAFKHFEDEVWGKDIRKSDDPEAKRIRGAAENLFRNEIIGENAAAYQDQQKAKGIDVSDQDALRFAAASGDLDQQIATRLDDYLKKEADEPSRLHMLMGKMPVTRTDAGKMVSLDRENIPKEIRDLWGQYDDPATNFAKTLSVLANHNAHTRMQNALVNDGLEKGYFWKQGESPGPKPPGLVQMTRDTRGPFVGVHGPPALKEGLSLMNQRPVRSLFAELNSVPLMMKTVQSIGSAVRNFFGNPLFMVSNGNLPISAVYWPKAFWLSLQRAADFMATSQGRKQLTRMIELGVLDESVDAKILERIAKNARVGHKWEGQAGFGASIAAIQRSFVKGAEKIAIPLQRVYTMADNFWRLANYNVELLRQKWMNPDLSLEQQEENAAEITRRTLPTYSNIIEGFRESYGKASEFAAPYLSFQAEAVRTYASSVYLAIKEISSDNPKEKLSGAWRLGGLALATSLPMTIGIASKMMFGYDDDDEKAIRAGLPEYQRNNMLFFLPRGPNKEPRYIDLNFVNPLSLLSTVFTSAWRGEGVGGTLRQAAKPFYSLQPVAQLGMDLWTNKDWQRGGGQIYDPYASGGEKAASVLKRVGRDAIPGTVDSAIKIGEAYTGKVSEKTGEKRDLREEVMKVFPGTADVTFDRDKAMQMHVNEYKTAARNAAGLFDRKMSADGPIGDGEVKATYREADERSYRAFQEMHKAYLGLLKLKMKPEDAIKHMLAGFGSEQRKGGLGKTALAQILSGNYQQFMPSDALLKETAVLHPERVVEFGDAQRQQARSRTASP